MSRKPRVVIPGMPHHITHRGTRRFDLFRADNDRLDYLEVLRESCHRFRLRIWAYCLMTNHVHLIAVPEGPESIRRSFHRTSGVYARAFNARYGFVGHLWQERPFSCVVSGSHLINAARYVETNPVRAGMVDRAADYRWSSARAHCFGENNTLLDPTWSPSLELSNWAEWLDGEADPLFAPFIRVSTLTGSPCGDEAFIRSVELSTGRSFARKKPGPAPKQNAKQNPTLPGFDEQIR